MTAARLSPAGTALLLFLAATAPAGAQAPQGTADRSTRPRVVAADIAFVQGMIHHHAQALVMTDLVLARASDPSLPLLAERITVSQRDEIGFMQRWLAGHGADAPEPPVTLDAARTHHGHAMLMPGMLTADRLERLAAADGPEFDRLFLQSMITHHEGALTMVADLFGAPGAGQDSWVYQFASDVDADQRAEIRRMRRMLAEFDAAVRD